MKATNMTKRDWIFIVLHTVVILGAMLAQYISIKTTVEAYGTRLDRNEIDIGRCMEYQHEHESEPAHKEVKIYMEYMQRDMKHLQQDVKEIRKAFRP